MFIRKCGKKNDSEQSVNIVRRKVWISCVFVSSRFLRSGVSGLSFRIDFFRAFFLVSFLSVFVGIYDLPREGVPIAFDSANLSCFGSE